MPFKQVTEQDLVGKGVIGQPAVPGLSVTEMQKSVEQVVREVAIPAHNQLCEQLQAQTAAEDIGAAPPGEEDLPAETPAKLQNVLQAMMAWAKEKLGLKADKADTYTKQQVEQAISNRVVAIGAGDMAMAVYDPESKKKPYLPADEGMAKAVYDADGDGMVDTARTAQTLAGQAAQAFLTKAVYDTDDDGVVDKAKDAATLGGKAEARLSVANAAALGGKTLSMELSGTTLEVLWEDVALQKATMMAEDGTFQDATYIPG